MIDTVISNRVFECEKSISLKTNNTASSKVHRPLTDETGSR